MARLELEVGQVATRSNTITREHVDQYAQMTGDHNPLHFDEDFAGQTSFGRLVVHGGLTTGILNALIAQDMPGPGSVFMSMDLRFTKPVYVGDTITASATVTRVHPTKPVCTLDVAITRTDGEVVVVGSTVVYQMHPDHEE